MRHLVIIANFRYYMEELSEWRLVLMTAVIPMIGATHISLYLTCLLHNYINIGLTVLIIQ